MPHDSITVLLPLPLNDDALIPSFLMQFYIGIAPQTLARWRHEGKGPKFVKVGRKVTYLVADIREWLGSQRKVSTS